MALKEILTNTTKILRVSLGISLPFEDLIKGFLSLVERLDQLGEDEVLRVALYWAVYQAIGDTLKELGKDFDHNEDFQEAIKNLFGKLDEKLTPLGEEKKEIFDLNRFSLKNFYKKPARKPLALAKG